MSVQRCLFALFMTTLFSISAIAAEPTAAPADRLIADIRYHANSLTDVIENLRVQTNNALYVDWNHLGIDLDTPVTLRMRNAKFRDVVTGIFQAADTSKPKPVVAVIDNVVVVTSPARMAEIRRLRAIADQDLIDRLMTDGDSLKCEPRIVLGSIVPRATGDSIDLEDGFAFLSVGTAAKFYVDWPSLGSAGVHRDTKVQNVFGGARLSTVLSLILFDLSTDRIKLVYKVRDSKICIFAEPVPPPTTAPTDPADAIVLLAHYNSNSATDVVEELRDVSKADIFVEWDQIGVARDAEVSGEFKNASLSTILAKIFGDAVGDKAKPVVETVANIVVVTTPDRLKDLKARITAHAGDKVGPDASKNLLSQNLLEANFNANLLSDVIEFESDVSGIHFDVDWDALKKAGVEKDKLITMRLRDVSVCTSLTMLFFQLSTEKGRVDYKIDDGKIRVIATRK